MPSAEVNVNELAKEWLRLDRNPETRREIEKLLEKNENERLSSRLKKRISFGTAGLRARMCAGFSCMNDLIVIQTSQGLAKYLIDQNDQAAKKGVVIGHDHRHNSERFAQLACVAFLRKGIKCYLLKGYVATPLVPFGVKHLGAEAGVMITASHNQASDNGYKLYYSNGVQIIAPHDAGISKSIGENLEVSEEAWDLSLIESKKDELCVDRTDVIKENYFDCILEVNKRPLIVNAKTQITFVYTPIHGVGLEFATRAFEQAGFPKNSFVPVEEQKSPDPNFPTVKFPNPEEKGALDLAMKLGESKIIEDPNKKIIILANDPDADRFCTAEWNGDSWNLLTGDQIGAIMGFWIFQKYKSSKKDVAKLAMLASTASSKLLAYVAKKEGFKFKETLTGFKHLGNAALDLEKEGYHVPFAYEEALGYMCGTNIRDKDGISALVVWAEISSEIVDAGDTLSGFLEEIFSIYGHFSTSNGYFISKKPSHVASRFNKLRFGEAKIDFTSVDRDTLLTSIKYPRTLGPYPITQIRDLTIGYDTEFEPSFMPQLPTSASSQMITFKIGGEGGEVVVTLRTSGTELWKLKYYVEGHASNLKVAKDKVARVVELLGKEWGLSHL